MNYLPVPVGLLTGSGLIGVLGILISASGHASTVPSAREKTILVSAASSLTNAMKEISAAFSAVHPDLQVRLNFAASGSLEKQIEAGAPVDVFASAGEKEMDELAKEGDIVKGSVKSFASNRLVLIAPTDSSIRSWSDLTRTFVRRIALPKPDLVPSGRYGKETLLHRHLWNLLEPKLVYAENVRQALAYVANGDVDAGVVFSTDAQIEKIRVKIVALASPRSDHTPIVYPAAVVARSQDPIDALLFTKFLVGKQAQNILKSQGFSPSR